MAHLVLTGATGLVGSAVLTNLLARPAKEVAKVTILSRREVPYAHSDSRFEVIIHRDFSVYPDELLARLKGATGAVWAQGISITQVPRAEYHAITIDYPLAAAKAFSGLSESFNFVYVSGAGATTSPKFYTAEFGRVKGQSERNLLALAQETPSLKAYSARPAFVDKAGHKEMEEASALRNTPLADVLVPKVLGPFLRLMPSVVSPTKELSKALVDLALSDGKPVELPGVEQGRILENTALRTIAKDGIPSQTNSPV